MKTKDYIEGAEAMKKFLAIDWVDFERAGYAFMHLTGTCNISPMVALKRVIEAFPQHLTTEH